MDWKEYAKDLLIFQVKLFSLPIEDVTKEKIQEFKDEFIEIREIAIKGLAYDPEADAENYYQEIGIILDRLKKLLIDEELTYGNTIDAVNSVPDNLDEPGLTLGEVYEMNMTNQPPTRLTQKDL
tara:strand:- start:75 stop:446 length:372 start_codon:yes stop_codon:yes gene_type:complete